MKRFSTLILSLFLLVACLQKAELSSPSPDGGYRFTFGVTPMEGETKSSFDPTTPNKATSIYMLAYQNGVLDESKSGYFVPASSARADFNNGDVYNLYFLKNTTKFIGDDWTAGELDLHSEANLAQLTYSIESYAVFNETGFPQAGAFPNWVAGDSPTHFDLDRQVARIVLGLKYLTKENVHLTVNGVRIHNAAKTIRPFGAAYAAETTDDILNPTASSNPTDYASEGDLSAIDGLNKEGEKAWFYVFENAQGTLLPDNTDPLLKTPESLKDAGHSDKQGLVTYIEVACSATTQASTVGEVKFNVCLGGDATTNFDIFKNKEYMLDVKYISKNISDKEWTQTSKEYDNTQSGFAYSRDTAFVCPGIDDCIYIYGVGRDNFIEIDESELEFTGSTQKVSYSFEREEDVYKVTFSTSEEITQNTTVYGINDEIPYREAKLIIKSTDAYNGSPNAIGEVPVRIYNAIFPMQFRYNSETGRMEVRANNPMEMGFRFSVSITSASGTTIASGTVTQRATYSRNSLGRLSKDKHSVVGKEWVPLTYIGKGITGTSGVRFNINVIPFAASMESVGNVLPADPIFKEGTMLYNGRGANANYGPGMGIPAYGDFNTAGWSTSGSSGGTSGSIGGNDGSISFAFYTGCMALYDTNSHSVSYKNRIRQFSLSSRGSSVTWNDGLCDGALGGIVTRGGLPNGTETKAGETTKVKTYDGNEVQDNLTNEVFGSCPFYVMNGDLSGYSNWTNIGGIGDGDSKWATIELYSLQGGRDLFKPYTSRESSGLSTYSHFGTEIWAKKQWLGISIHIWSSPIQYTYGVHMTINGKTAWPLADKSEKGSEW